MGPHNNASHFRSCIACLVSDESETPSVFDGVSDSSHRHNQSCITVYFRRDANSMDPCDLPMLISYSSSSLDTVQSSQYKYSIHNRLMYLTTTPPWLSSINHCLRFFAFSGQAKTPYDIMKLVCFTSKIFLIYDKFYKFEYILILFNIYINIIFIIIHVHYNNTSRFLENNNNNTDIAHHAISLCAHHIRRHHQILSNHLHINILFMID
jgi:hypothetical protein